MTADPLLLDHWFGKGLTANPDGPALRIGAASWTYRELDRIASAWAAALVEGGRPARVGVLASKSFEAFAGFLAVLYAGAAAVPLGPETPPARNLAVAEAAGIGALICDPAGAPQLPGLLPLLRGAGRVIAPRVDERYRPDNAVPVAEQAAASAPGPAPPPAVVPDAQRSPDDLAYLLFTSGSTGTPKGVPISHRNVCAFLSAITPRYELSPTDVFSQVCEPTFDVSVFETWTCWAAGACLRVLTRLQALDPVRFANNHGVTVWTATPSLVAALQARDLAPPGTLPGIRYTVLAGEPLSVATARYWRRAAPASVVDNLYGPTELTVTCTGYRWPAGEPARWPDSATVPIGEPNTGLDVLLWGGDGRPAEDRGELCVCGPQMFGGYLDPADDHGRFLEHGGRTWYRTGDQVRRDPRDGLVHLGRLDGQVKVRGYRVELAEVERALMRLTGSPASVLLVDRPSGPVLVAFVMAHRPLDLEGARAGLAARLPAYMLPAQLWQVADFPLTASGKVDQRWLVGEAGRLLNSG